MENQLIHINWLFYYGPILAAENIYWQFSECFRIGIGLFNLHSLQSVEYCLLIHNEWIDYSCISMVRGKSQRLNYCVTLRSGE